MKVVHWCSGRWHLPEHQCTTFHPPTHPAIPHPPPLHDPSVKEQHEWRIPHIPSAPRRGTIRGSKQPARSRPGELIHSGHCTTDHSGDSKDIRVISGRPRPRLISRDDPLRTSCRQEERGRAHTRLPCELFPSPPVGEKFVSDVNILGDMFSAASEAAENISSKIGISVRKALVRARVNCALTLLLVPKHCPVSFTYIHTINGRKQAATIIADYRLGHCTNR